jgi:hypothetical protein
LAAVLEQEKLSPVFLGEKKADRAVAPEVFTRNAATGTHAVDLVDADVGAHVKFAPGFDEDGAARLFGEEKFQGRTFVFDVGHRRGFECMVIQAVRPNETCRRQFAEGRRHDSEAHPRIKSSSGVLPRVSAKRDPNRLAGPDSDRDPEMIDVGRDAIDFSSESDWGSGDMDEVAMVQIGVNVSARSIASVRQWLREGWGRRVRDRRPG